MFGYAQINHTRLYFEIEGAGEPLVLIHSGYTDLRMWDEQVKYFSQYFKVLRYDLRGFGRSDTPMEPFSHVMDLYCLLRHLKIEKAILLGVSKGGSIAVDFTLSFPDMVKKIILSGASLSGYQFEPDEASKLRSAAGVSMVKRDEDFAASVEYLLNDPMWRQTDPRVRERLQTMFIETSLKWVFYNLEEPPETLSVNRLPEIHAPVFIIVGENDSIPILAISEFYKRNIKSSKRVFIKGTGHLPNMDKPEEFNKIVINFLQPKR